MKIKKLSYISLASVVVAMPLATLSCGIFEGKGDWYENYKNDFALSQIRTDQRLFLISESEHSNDWGHEWSKELSQDGFDMSSTQNFFTRSSDGNDFNEDFVNNFLSSNKNLYNWTNDSQNSRVHNAVTIINDSDSSLMSIFAEDSYLKDPSDVFSILDIDNVNQGINEHLYSAAIDNASIEVNGAKVQLGVPYSFELRGLYLAGNAYDDFDKHYSSGEFDNSKINGKNISEIITTDNHVTQLINYISENGWTWNEMASFADKISDVSSLGEEYAMISDDVGFGLESFISAKRFAGDGQLLWDGVSDDWNSDIFNTLATQNNIDVNEAENIISKMMELSAPWTDASTSYDRNSIFGIATTNTSDLSSSPTLLPMPLYTNGGDDVYADLVVGSNSLYLPDDEQFFSSKTGLSMQEKFLELMVSQTLHGQRVSQGFPMGISPYTPTEWLVDAQGDNYALADIMLSDTNDHSYSSTRWLGDWYRNTLSNSVKWSGSTTDRWYSYTFDPLNSVDRDKNLYDNYDLITT